MVFSWLRRGFTPREGMKIMDGLVLTLRPLLSQVAEVKFSAFAHPKFSEVEHYKKFELFLPEEFKIIGPPTGQNCFGFCMGMEKEGSSKEFGKWLLDNGYDRQNSVEPEAGDRVIYSNFDPLFGISHAAVSVGNGRVQARWGRSPLIEHPIDEVVPNYMMPDFGFRSTYRKVA